MFKNYSPHSCSSSLFLLTFTGNLWPSSRSSVANWVQKRLEVPMAVLLDALRARLGPDTRITAIPSDTVTPAPSGKPVGKGSDRPWGKKTPTPSPSTPQVTFAKPLATSATTPTDESKVRCFSCQQLGHRSTKCPKKPMTQEEHNAVAKAQALHRQRNALLADFKKQSLNSLREVFDKGAYQAASAHRTAIMKCYGQESKT